MKNADKIIIEDDEFLIIELSDIYDTKDLEMIASKIPMITNKIVFMNNDIIKDMKLIKIKGGLPKADSSGSKKK